VHAALDTVGHLWHCTLPRLMSRGAPRWSALAYEVQSISAESAELLCVGGVRDKESIGCRQRYRGQRQSRVASAPWDGGAQLRVAAPFRRRAETETDSPSRRPSTTSSPSSGSCSLNSSRYSRNLLKSVQSHTRHEIKSRHKAHSAIGGISMMVLVSRFLPYSGTRKCFSTSS
jgi:hypothetical protein